jgi:hypothetical protein
VLQRLDLDPRLIALMECQGGVFTAPQARQFGHTLDDLQRLRTRAPRPLVSVRRGVYACREAYEGATGPARHLIEIAAVEHCLDNSPVLSHESGAVWHELPLLDADLTSVHVTRRPPSRPRLEAGVHHHVAELPDEQTIRRPGRMSVVTMARSAVDVARATNRLECAVAACDSALRMGVPREELWEVFHGMRSWPGARLVARAIEMADGRADNPGESFSRVVLVRLGLPPDELQVPMWDDEGLIGYSDFGWVGVYGELDGGTKYGLDDPDRDEHEAKRVVWREKKREDRMRVRREVVRWGIADLYRPQALRGRVLAAMARATARGLRPA